MKNQAGIYQALLEGKTLISNASRVKLINRNVHEFSGEIWYENLHYSFGEYESWEIEQQWYEKDISNGVLCRVRDYIHNEWIIGLIIDHNYNRLERFEDETGETWIQAEPLDLTKPLLPQLEDK